MNKPKTRRPAKTVAAYGLFGIGLPFLCFSLAAFAAGLWKLKVYTPAEAEVLGWIRYIYTRDYGYVRLTDEALAMRDTTLERIGYAPRLALKVPGHGPLVFEGQLRFRDGPGSGLKSAPVYYRDKRDGSALDYFEYSILKCYVMPVAFVLLSGLCFFPGAWLLRDVLRDRKRKRFLRASGKRIAAEFVSAEEANGFSDGLGARFIINARWKDPETGVVKTFRGGEFWPDPTPVLQGGTIDVLVDPRDYGIFCFDFPEMREGPPRARRPFVFARWAADDRD